ncbi:MAG TPA: 6,7-dimethyl-8-ribityllumazine synthase [Nitrososphaeraceae archaeon]|nr:6,7-dimethyl-8-ribityllumazine synthase [Nitrososphaeraceae archaeon]HJT85109.1 6,7-dimethyl-8-ribityllumazine synthase [Nitrososphaeraceae archaeon]
MIKIRLAIVVSEFNYEITKVMLEEAKVHASKLNSTISHICYVPGTFDMPLVISYLLQDSSIDAIITLGAVIKGDTNHDILIAENTARLISDLSLNFKKPIALGISGPNMTVEQAWERSKTVPIRAVNAAINMVTRIKKLNEMQHNQNETIIIK